AIEIAALTFLVGLGELWWSRRRGQPAAPWRWLALCIAATVLSHLYLDWQGSYGLRPFLPWSSRWYYADWVAIVDPVFWLAPLVAGARWPPDSGWCCLAGALTRGRRRGRLAAAPDPHGVRTGGGGLGAPLVRRRRAATGGGIWTARAGPLRRGQRRRERAGEGTRARRRAASLRAGGGVGSSDGDRSAVPLDAALRQRRFGG